MNAINRYIPKDLRNNKLHDEDRSFHDWYRFVLSYPPHLVRLYIERFSLDNNSTILDPFCGTGTTIVEAKKNKIKSYGLEASPMGHFASKVKTNWPNKQNGSKKKWLETSRKARNSYLKNSLDLRLTHKQEQILLKNSISDIPLHKCLSLLNEIKQIEDIDIKNILLLALASTAVFSASNLKFGPEVGIRKKKKEDANVFVDFDLKVKTMFEDLNSTNNDNWPTSTVLLSDSRNINRAIPEKSINAIITSPPYPNEKDYTRTTRLESVLLGFINNKQELRDCKQNFLRSNTRNVYKKDFDDELIPNGSQVDRIAKEIERRRIALNKTSGFERLYHRVTRLYFGGMKRHLIGLQRYLKPGAKLAYVVGDQASYLQVMIRTGEILAEIAHEIGYKVIDLELFRTRLSTVTGEQLREEILVLEYNDRSSMIMKKTDKSKNRYDQLIEKVFFKNYNKGSDKVDFKREEFEPIAKELGIKLPKNLGDIIYSYRYRNKLPKRINQLLNKGEEWIIRSTGRGKYLFAKSTMHRINPNPRLTKIKILDATPEIIRRYALNDEQALLAILRYNRLIDIFLGITCYPLQSHLRTSVPKMGQVETDEIYIGVNNKGSQYVIPVQAKGKTDELGVIQIEQDYEICKTKFPSLICRSVAAQFIKEDLISLFELEIIDGEVTIKEEKHYHIVPNKDLQDSEINRYKHDE